MLVIGAVDWLHGVSVAAYFWIAAAILLGGFLVSVIARRTVWFAVVLLVPALLGGIATHGVAAGFGDGAGQRTWQPDGVPSTQYRLLAGDARLDLSSVSLTDARTVRVDIGAGQLTIHRAAVAPPRDRQSHQRRQVSDFTAVDSGHRNNGWSVHEVTTRPPTPPDRC